jgi:tetratricopeptide (TPR) repeat protein/TolB-like protein
MRESVLAARAVVVLPFLDLDAVEENPIATGQVVSSLRSQLESLGSARVSTSGMLGWGRLEELRKAAREAKGRAILTGTVRKVEGKRRLSLRLVDPASGQTLFSTLVNESEMRPFSGETEQWARDIHKILSTASWSDLLSTKTDPGLRNEVAAEAMKSGRAWLSSYTVSDIDQAIALFNKAIAAEPNSALAHAYLAIAASGRTHFVVDPKYLELGESEALKALSLDPRSAEGHRALAGVYYQEGRFYDALEEQMRAIEIGGAEERVAIFVGMTLDFLGWPVQALKWFQVASRLQTRPGLVEPSIGDSWTKLGDDEQALRAFERAIELEAASPQGAIGECHVHLLRGEFDEAREICRHHFRNPNELGEMAQMAAQIEFFARNYGAAEELYVRLLKNDPYGGGSFYGATSYQSALGRIRQVLGSDESATKLLQESLEREVTLLNRQPGNPEAAYRVAAVEASLNLSEAALQHLHQAVALGWLDYRSLQRDPRFDSLRTSPELDTLIDGLSAKVADLRSKAKAR